MQVKSIAECSKWSILQYLRPSLSYQLLLKSLFCLILSGRFTQVLLCIVVTPCSCSNLLEPFRSRIPKTSFKFSRPNQRIKTWTQTRPLGTICQGWLCLLRDKACLKCISPADRSLLFIICFTGKLHTCIGGSRRRERVSAPPPHTHAPGKSLAATVYISLEILVRTPFKQQLDGHNCFSGKTRIPLREKCWCIKTVIRTLSPWRIFLDPRMCIAVRNACWKYHPSNSIINWCRPKLLYFS